MSSEHTLVQYSFNTSRKPTGAHTWLLVIEYKYLRSISRYGKRLQK